MKIAVKAIIRHVKTKIVIGLQGVHNVPVSIVSVPIAPIIAAVGMKAVSDLKGLALASKVQTASVRNEIIPLVTAMLPVMAIPPVEVAIMGVVMVDQGVIMGDMVIIRPANRVVTVRVIILQIPTARATAILLVAITEIAEGITPIPGMEVTGQAEVTSQTEVTSQAEVMVPVVAMAIVETMVPVVADTVIAVMVILTVILGAIIVPIPPTMTRMPNIA